MQKSYMDVDNKLSRSFLYLSNHGLIPKTENRILTQSQAKRINTLMLSCGTYDEAGDFAYLVGMPGKSGVGGGIAAIIPNELSIAVWSPALNKKGNSLAGLKALELFTSKTGMSIF
jgi:glutaminase